MRQLFLRKITRPSRSQLLQHYSTRDHATGSTSRLQRVQSHCVKKMMCIDEHERDTPQRAIY
jgi:hypothetical protein